MQKIIRFAIILTWMSFHSELAVAQIRTPGKVTIDIRRIESQIRTGAMKEKGHSITGDNHWHVRRDGPNHFNNDRGPSKVALNMPAARFRSSTSLVGQLAYDDDTAKPIVLKRHTKAVSTVAWSSDGKTLATASDDRSIRVWDPSTGRQVAFLPEIARNGFGGPVVAFTPDLRTAAVNYWGEVTLRNVADGKVRSTIMPIPDVKGQRSAFRPDVYAMKFSPDGKRLATAGSVGIVGGRHGLPGGVVIIWDVATGELIHQSATLSTAASSVVWSPDGTSYAAGTNGAGGELPEAGKVWVWNAETGKVLNHFSVQPKVAQGEWASAGDVTFSPDGKRIAVPVTAGSLAKPAGLVNKDSGASVQIWDLADGNARQFSIDLTAAVSRVVFSPDGKTLAAPGRDKVLRFWDIESEKEQAALPCEKRITAIAFSPDGKFLVGGFIDGSARIWSVTKVE